MRAIVAVVLALVVAAGCGSSVPSAARPSAAPAVWCSELFATEACMGISRAAIDVVSTSDRSPTHVWVSDGYICPWSTCLFDPNQNFPMPMPSPGEVWVASVEIAFAGTDEHAGLYVWQVGATYRARLIGIRVPLPGWCSGYCGTPPPS